MRDKGLTDVVDSRGERLLPNLVPMRMMKKDTFSELGSAQRCHRLA